MKPSQNPFFLNLLNNLKIKALSLDELGDRMTGRNYTYPKGYRGVTLVMVIKAQYATPSMIHVSTKILRLNDMLVITYENMVSSITSSDVPEDRKYLSAARSGNSGMVNTFQAKTVYNIKLKGSSQDIDLDLADYGVDWWLNY